MERGAITARGHGEWLDDLGREVRIHLWGGTSVLLVHASTGRDEGPGITAELFRRETLQAKSFACAASLVSTGHTH